MQVLVAQDVGGTASETYCRCKSSIKIAEQSPTQTLQAAWMLLVCLCGFMLNQQIHTQNHSLYLFNGYSDDEINHSYKHLKELKTANNVKVCYCKNTIDCF